MRVMFAMMLSAATTMSEMITTFIYTEFVAFLRDNFIELNVIADHVEVSRNTLRWRCQREGYVDTDTFAQLITNFIRMRV